MDELALIARLYLTEEEKKILPQQISSILDMVHSLETVDTEDVEPTIYPITGSGVLREDEILPSLAVKDALANGPDIVDGYFRVPRIIEEEYES